ncbi:Nucleolar protein 9, partial [Linderina macrospora]
MGSDVKRKTRRGKRGGESKRKTHEDNPDQPEVQNHTPAPAAPVTDSGYVAPPMDSGNGDSLFFEDRAGARAPLPVDGQYSEQDESRVTPASYGLVNPDLQHYLKSCEAMLDSAAFENPEDQDIFVNNVYSEAKNFELQLTTDHECSRILEKLFRVSRDYHIRKYFALTRDDTLRLVIHRFSSHVLQSLLLLTASALERECRGESSDFPPEDDDQDEGVRTPLPTFEQLVLGLTETLKPHWQSLMVNEYASHVLRVLLLVLAGDPIEDPSSKAKSSIKSRRSTKYMEDRNGLPSQDKALLRKRRVPESFGPALDQLLRELGDSIGDTDARMLANDKLGSHVLQLMITLQASRTSVEYPGSLLDKLLMGLISNEVDQENTRRDTYIRTMLEDVVGSHFLEITLRIASPALLQRLYTRYF